MLALVPEPLVVAEATVVAPFFIATVNWSAAFTRPVTDFARVSFGAGAVFVKVHEIASATAGVIENDVPLPLGSVVLEPELLLVQAIELVYAPIADTEPLAIESVKVYVVPAPRLSAPVVAVVPVPVVVPVATALAPFMTFTLNWSLALIRPLTVLPRVSCGAAPVFV